MSNATQIMLCAGNALGQKMLVSKAQVSLEARAAVSCGTGLLDACRYPLTSEAGRHFWFEYWGAMDKVKAC